MARFDSVESRSSLSFGRTLRLSSDRHDLLPPPLWPKRVEIYLTKPFQNRKDYINLYPKEYTFLMYFIEKTVEFDKWLQKLKDLRAKAKILFRIQKLESEGHFGDCKPVEGVRELKINYAKGYRVYFNEKDEK